LRSTDSRSDRAAWIYIDGDGANMWISTDNIGSNVYGFWIGLNRHGR
jgi:hypothetical protein